MARVYYELLPPLQATLSGPGPRRGAGEAVRVSGSQLLPCAHPTSHGVLHLPCPSGTIDPLSLCLVHGYRPSKHCSNKWIRKSVEGVTEGPQEGKCKTLHWGGGAVAPLQRVTHA